MTNHNLLRWLALGPAASASGSIERSNPTKRKEQEMKRTRVALLVLAAVLGLAGCNFDMCLYADNSLCGIIP
jgi:hypothetical protein